MQNKRDWWHAQVFLKSAYAWLACQIRCFIKYFHLLEGPKFLYPSSFSQIIVNMKLFIHEHVNASVNYKHPFYGFRSFGNPFYRRFHTHRIREQGSLLFYFRTTWIGFVVNYWCQGNCSIRNIIGYHSSQKVIITTAEAWLELI